MLWGTPLPLRAQGHADSLTTELQAASPTMEHQVDSVGPDGKPRPTKYISAEAVDEYMVFFQGFTLSADVFNALLYTIADYGTLEAALRLNLKNTYFPIFEMGYGRCTKEDYNTLVKYHTAAPFARLGFDWNVLKNKFQNSRLYVGVRYGFSRFNYDVSGPEMTDPIWGGSEPFSIKGIRCTSHWMELGFGAEMKIYRNFHMGWTVCYKKELGSTKSDYSKPDCIPGYGYTTKSSCWGGSYSLIFDLNWGKKKSHQRGLHVEIKDNIETPTQSGSHGEEKIYNGDQPAGAEDTI